jgi:hypothetical protein
MNYLAIATTLLFLGASPALADHHGKPPPGPERGQGLSGQGAESSGGKSSEAIRKPKHKSGDSGADFSFDRDSDDNKKGKGHDKKKDKD